MKTHKMIIYHCLCCGAILHRDPELGEPLCCGKPMARAVETMEEDEPQTVPPDRCATGAESRYQPAEERPRPR